MLTDEALLHRIRAGDRAALEELYTRYLPVLWRYAFAQLRPDEAAARDAVGETFLAAMSAPHDRAKGSVAAWLMGIARHKIADTRRRRRFGELPAAIARDADPAELLQRQETSAAVARIMAALDDEERLALEWKYIDGATVREIAARLDRTEKAAEAVLFRARAEFRRHARTLLDPKGEPR